MRPCGYCKLGERARTGGDYEKIPQGSGQFAKTRIGANESGV